MTMNIKRRFLYRYLLDYTGRCIQEFKQGLEETHEKADLEQFFESYESSYALTLAYPDDILLETAKKYGIEIKNRSKKEIVKELFVK